MYPCLKALKALGGSGTNEEILDKVIELEKYPADIQQVQHKDNRQTVLNYRLAWAKSYLKVVGAIVARPMAITAIRRRHLPRQTQQILPAAHARGGRCRSWNQARYLLIFSCCAAGA
jgi:hypothetical protein